MAYSPNETQRPAFVKACANRRRFVADIIRSVKDDADYKSLYEHIFPDRVAPNVKLPQGYKEILEGTLLDGSVISDVQLENLRSDLMEELRKENSSISNTVDEKTRTSLQRVVMVTAPNWISEFKPTNKMFDDNVKEQFSSSKTPLPENDSSVLRGPVSFVLILFGVMIVSLVVRLMLSAASSSSDDFVLKQGTNDANYELSTRSLSSIKTFPTGTGNNALGKSVKGLFENNVHSPNISMSYGIIPGFVLYELLQTGLLVLYVALMPFVLIVANTSQMLGMRSMQMIESIESVLFSTNNGYAKMPKFNVRDRIQMKDLFKKQIRDIEINLEDLVENVKALANNSDTSPKIRLLLKGENAETFVTNNLKRFMSQNDTGTFNITDQALESAMDSYNLLRFDAEGMKQYFGVLPNFLGDIARSSFSYPVLVKMNDREYKVASHYFWQTESQSYLKVPAATTTENIPKFVFNARKDPISGKESVTQVGVRFSQGATPELVSSIPKGQSGAVDAPTYGSDGNNTQTTPSADSYLLVRDDQANEKQSLFNISAAITRGIGVFGGSMSSLATVLLLIVFITNVLERMFGNYEHYDTSMFQKMVFITSDAYYAWMNDSATTKSDVAKMHAYVTKTNAKVKIVDVSSANSDTDRINRLIQAYNEDVGSKSFIRNQLFFRTLYILFLVTLPFLAAWILGVYDSRLMFQILGSMGLEGLDDGRSILNAVLPVLTSVIFVASFTTAIVYMSKDWVERDPEESKEKDKPNYWKTTDSVGKSNADKAPMKVKTDVMSARERSRARRTLRFLTTSGSDSGSSLTQETQEKRVLKNDNVFNLQAFERTRVLFITEKNDLQGYFLKFIQDKVSGSSPSSSKAHQMKVSKQSGTMFSAFTGTLTAVIVAGIGFALWGILQSLSGSESGVDASQSNILQDGLAAMNILKKHLISYNDQGGQTYVVIAQGLIFLLASVMVFVNPLVADTEIATAASGKKMKATELAYGSLAYIDADARPRV